jgi:hypothetical protein
MTAIILSWVEVKPVCEALVKHPDNEDEKRVAEHILGVMDYHMRHAKPGSRATLRRDDSAHRPLSATEQEQTMGR